MGLQSKTYSQGNIERYKARLVATMNDDEEPVLQDPIEPIATHEGEQQ